MSSPAWPPIFRLDQARILQLLTGDRFYSNPSAALREAVLNALDATQRMQSEHLGHIPSVEVVFDRNALSLSVTDNGIGMGRKEISDLFATVGASAANLDSNTHTVGEFGIGVVSYFMAGNSFSLDTHDGGSYAIGLSFDKGMLIGGSASEIPPSRDSRGTTLTMQIRSQDTFDVLIRQFGHWFRDVQGLSGVVMPESMVLRQGLVDRSATSVQVAEPHWVERAHLAPVSGPEGWEGLTGVSKVDVLYRGVFVQEFEAPGLWGIQGSVDVDPKHFKPRLNREGFIEGEFQSSVTGFLASAHPAILRAMAGQLGEAVAGGELGNWNVKRWANLWLSVPRRPEYSEACAAWDSVFRTIPAFERGAPRGWEAISFEQLLGLGPRVFVAPQQRQKTNDVVEAAVKFLRNTGEPMVRGIERDPNWMKPVARPFGTTADLIAGVFADELPEMVSVASQAERILGDIETLAPLFTGPPRVDLVQLGEESIPVLKLRNRVLINADSAAGMAIVLDVLESNSGPLELIGITARHAHQNLAQVASVAREGSGQPEILGPVRRQYIRSLVG